MGQQSCFQSEDTPFFRRFRIREKTFDELVIRFGNRAQNSAPAYSHISLSHTKGDKRISLSIARGQNEGIVSLHTISNGKTTGEFAELSKFCQMYEAYSHLL